jgi:hypothetical protein
MFHWCSHERSLLTDISSSRLSVSRKQELLPLTSHISFVCQFSEMFQSCPHCVKRIKCGSAAEIVWNYCHVSSDDPNLLSESANLSIFSWFLKKFWLVSRFFYGTCWKYSIIALLGVFLKRLIVSILIAALLCDFGNSHLEIMLISRASHKTSVSHNNLQLVAPCQLHDK